MLLYNLTGHLSLAGAMKYSLLPTSALVVVACKVITTGIKVAKGVSDLYECNPEPSTEDVLHIIAESVTPSKSKTTE